MLVIRYCNQCTNTNDNINTDLWDTKRTYVCVVFVLLHSSFAAFTFASHSCLHVSLQSNDTLINSEADQLWHVIQVKETNCLPSESWLVQEWRSNMFFRNKKEMTTNQRRLRMLTTVELSSKVRTQSRIWLFITTLRAVDRILSDFVFRCRHNRGKISRWCHKVVELQTTETMYLPFYS